MIYVSENQLDQVNYLLEQSAYGNHLLFSIETVRRVARKATIQKTFDRTRTEKAEAVLEQMILCPTLQEKRRFLDKLDAEMHDDVARIYFNIVQNAAIETQTKQ